MNIGSTIKKFRRAKDMTQEDIAEYLGVSVSAVSQWEANKTAPDLSLIAPLCNLLDVSADELLGIDLEAKQEKIDEIVHKAYSYDSRGYSEDAYNILSEGLREFPDSFDIMFHLMYNNNRRADDSSYSESERNKFRDEAIRIAELILEKCPDEHKRYSAIQVLSFIYPNVGKTERAVELANKMPHMVLSQDFLYTNIYNGSKGYRYDKCLLYDLIQSLSSQITASWRKKDNGEFYYTKDERAALRDKRIAFLSLMFEDGDMGFYHCHLSDAHMRQSLYYAQKNDSKNTLEHLAKAAEHAIGFVKYAHDDNYTHTSLLFRDYENGGGSFSTNANENDALQLLSHMTSKEYDFVRDTPEFTMITGDLKVYAEKWKPMK